jgi:hypothetical protein
MKRAHNHSSRKEFVVHCLVFFMAFIGTVDPIQWTQTKPHYRDIAMPTTNTRSPS